MPASPFDDSRRAQFVELRETHDPALRDELVEAHLPLATHLAHRFANRGVPFDDLVQVASLGLVHAVDRFDPDMGTTFGTFATPTILGEIKRHFRDRAWDLHVPRRLQELHIELNSVIAHLTQKLGRSPTIAELSTATRASDEEIVEAIEAGRAYNVSSLEAPNASRSGTETERALLVSDRSLETSDTRVVVQEMLQELAPREQLIMRMRFWEHLSQADIARRLGISQMHVSRLLARSLTEIQSRLGDEFPDS